ncbi:MAG: hypothetical protein DMG65_20600 [Candidatus Angelobacter sp. Gp1-AA117]|nr:MAG: hypothetical protein DMG65_20600 [Candidatus Angelobacter sp. Gp1-AA117]
MENEFAGRSQHHDSPYSRASLNRFDTIQSENQLTQQASIWNNYSEMPKYSTHQVAKKLGIGIATLTRYIQSKKIPAPKTTIVGAMRVRLWSDAEVERVRALLPKIANGRKTRYSKLKKEKPAPKRSKR